LNGQRGVFKTANAGGFDTSFIGNTGKYMMNAEALAAQPKCL
jgi:hypothetical protein